MGYADEMIRESTCLLTLAVLLSTAAGAATRPAIDGSGDCAGVSGRYLASLRNGSATVVSAAPFPGGKPGAAGDPAPSPGTTWRTTIPGFAPEASGCVAFDKDLFTWPGDLATYVEYLIRELLLPAQQLDPELATLAVRDRTVRLAVERAQRDQAVLSGPEGAMLGYGALADEERYFFIVVLLGDGDTALVRILRNRGQPFGERATTPIGFALLRGDAWVDSAAGPGFRLRRLIDSNSE
jgi:hypothetical protein